MGVSTKNWLTLPLTLLMFSTMGRGGEQSDHGPGEAESELAEVLREAHRVWLSDVSFRATYRVVRGSAPSMETALALPVENGPVISRGVLCKMGNWIRRSVEYEAEPVANQAGIGSFAIANCPVDEMSNGELDVSYGPGIVTSVTSTTGKVEFLDRSSRGTTGASAAGPITGSYYNPLRLIGGNEDDPFVLPGGSSGSSKVAFDVAAKDGATEITIRDSKSKAKRLRRLTFATEGGSPYLTEVEQVYGMDDGSENVVHAVASAFRNCDGRMVASRVRIAVAQPDGAMVEEWISDDLGSRKPTEDDFVIEISEDTSVIGLREPPQKGTKRRLALAAYKNEDLGQPLAVPPENGGGKPQSRSSTGVQRIALIVVINAAIVGIMLVAFRVTVKWRRP